MLTYVDNNRSQLKKEYPDVESFKNNYSISQKLFDDFLANAEKIGVKRDTAGLKISEKLIRLNLKAIVARELFNAEGLWEVMNEANVPLRKAIEAMQDNTFERMKIAGK
jgi:carboxyl-terminal processing protease